MESFQTTNTLLLLVLLADTEPSSWSFYLSSMFVGMMFSGVVLAKWSLSLRDITLRAFNFNKIFDFLESGCVEVFLVRIRQLIIYHTTVVFRSGCHPKDCVSLSNTAIPSIASKVVEFCSVTASTLPCTIACAFESNSVSTGRTVN